MLIDAAWGQLQERPDRTRSEVTLQGLTAVSAYDGKDGWSVSPFEGRRDAETASADDAREIAQEADFDGPLVDWKEKGHTVEYLGTEDVDGTPAHKLRVTLKDGDVRYVSSIPTPTSRSADPRESKVRGVEQITETDFGSYEQVAGVWVPFSIESGPKGGTAHEPAPHRAGRGQRRGRRRAPSASRRRHDRG